MASDSKGVSRRGFIAGAGLTGLGSMLALTGIAGQAQAAEEGATSASAAATEKGKKIPTRLFGKNKIPVSILSMGGMYPIPQNLIMLKKALDWGLTYWDTASGYEHGNSELGIGMFFEKFPETRKQVFLVTKSPGRNAAKLTEHLNQSFERMKTDHVDLFFLHGVNSPDEFTPEVKAWGEKMKAENKIKMFGFSAHKNMENLLDAASKLGWIDGIMIAYNYRIMHGDAMKRGVEACHKAGIGLTAMKTQGGGPIKTDSDAELKLAGRFVQKGFTPEQAKLKAVWENEMISAVCSQMPNITIMTANVAAAMDKSKLTAGDFDALKTYAEATCSSYCAGCSHICDAAVEGDTSIAEVMRYMMYHQSYRETHLARQHFAELPEAVRANLAKLDFSAAEQLCPQKIAIGEVMKQALEVLG